MELSRLDTLCSTVVYTNGVSFVFFTMTQSWQCWHCQLCTPIYLQFSSLFAITVVIKCKIRNQGVHEDYISRLHALLKNSYFFNGRAKTKLAMLAFLYCIDFVKNSNVDANINTTNTAPESLSVRLSLASMTYSSHT